MKSILNHRKDAHHSLGFTQMTKGLVRSGRSGRHSTIGKWLHIGLYLTLALAVCIFWQGAVRTQAMSSNDTSVWSVTGNLNMARVFHAATLLRNGKVLIIGGFGAGDSNSAELYDPATGIWTNTASSNMAHYYPTATLLPNGKVLVVSDDTVGIPTGGGAELFDPVTGTWSLTGRLNDQTFRTFHTATHLPNGKVLVAGGANGDLFFTATKSTELYDPATGTWTPTGSLIQPRASHTATLLSNGKVLVVGGVAADEGGPIYDSAELYDPATGNWSTTGSLSTARCDHTATLLANGKVLVTGGLLLKSDYFVTNSAELYDPNTGSWSATGSLTTTRHGHTATRLPNGEVLVAGGSSTNNASNASLNSGELYDPLTGNWSTASSLSTARQWHTATLLTNSRILVAGGESFSGGRFTVLNSAESYSPMTIPPVASQIQFSASSYFVNEGAGRLTVTVTRTGDTSAAASVDYKTTDIDTFALACSDTVNNQGEAYGRCDYATTVDTVNFAAGETAKTLTIPIIDDAFAEGNETFSVSLNNASGATLGAPETATVTINDNETANGANPIFTTPFFVRQQYLDFLSREPEASEPWSGVLSNCSDVNNNPVCDRVTVSAAFFGSQEFQLKGYFVYRFYKLGFNRLPTYTEIVTDMRAVTGQTPAEVFQKKAAFGNAFVQRTEFTNTYGAMTNAEYVSALMGRYSLTQITTPDPAQPDSTNKATLTATDLTNQLNSSTLTRSQVLRAIADSDQVFNAEFNQAFVAMQYYGYLRRAPEPAGFNMWLNYLNANPTDFRTMVNGFMNSTEYRLRFGS